MKKVLFLLLSVTFFSVAQAQNVDVERVNRDWSKLVNYVAIRYNQTALEYAIKDETTQKVYEERIKNECSTNQSPIWPVIILAVLIVLVVILLVEVLCLKRKIKKDNAILQELSNVNLTSANIQELKDMPQEFKTFQLLVEKRCANHEDELARLSASNRGSKDEPPYVEGEQPSVIYAKNSGGGILKGCAKEEAQYKLVDTQKGRFEFEFCGDVEYAKMNRDAVFENVCDLYGNPTSKIVNEKKGTAQAMGNDKWQVDEKAKVKFE